MKKTIQINIAGVIFNIEEDAYEILSSYLSSIQKYFSSYESSEEIYSDIEARIAEKFMGKNKADALPILNLESVERVIKSMGTVADFEALEEEEDFTENASEASDINEEPQEKKRLYRDTRRKALGGVLSGLANYFKVDVVWFRVIFLVGFLGLASTGIGGIFFLAYIICWIAFPANDSLPELENVKKFYRHEDNKVISGVASGLATYFGIDVAVIRILFVLSILFFGVGLVSYIILWVASPMAETITQKMEMKGEAVTIENIDSNIKQNLEEPKKKDRSGESALTSLLLLPFRIIAKIFQAIGSVLSHLGPLFRVVIGLIPLFIGIGLVIGAITGTIFYFGTLAGHNVFIEDREFSMFVRDLPPAGGIFLFLSTALPAIAVLLLGIFMISNKKIGNRSFWITGLGLWVIGMVGLAIFGGTYSMNFAKDGVIYESESIELNSDMLYLQSFRNVEDAYYFFDTEVRIEKATNEEISVEKRYTASGRNRDIAKENAGSIVYQIHHQDSILVFDNKAVLDEDAKFRNQKVRVTLKVPVGQKIHMSNKFAQILLADRWSIKSDYGLEYDDFDQLVFSINEDGDLVCLDCEILSEEEQAAYEERKRGYHSFYDEENDFKPRGEFDRTYDLDDFDGIEAGGDFRVLITQGEDYSVSFVGEKERDIQDLKVRVNNGVLDIDYKDRFFKDRKRVNVFITMPNLESIDLSGAAKLKVLSFENIDNLDMDISGASKAKIDIDAISATFDASGASTLEMIGKIRRMNLDLSGASRFNAENAEIEEAHVEASGASKAEFGDVNNLHQEVSGASHVSRN